MRGNYTKVVVGGSVQEGSIQEEKPIPSGGGVKTFMPRHEEGTVQVVHMTPEEYLRLAAPNVFGGIDEYQVSLVQERISKGEGFKVPVLDVFPDSMDVVASRGIYAATWAHNNGVKSIPVMMIHTKNTGSMFGPRQFVPTKKKRDINFRNLIRQGALGPSAWHYVEEKEENEKRDKL